MKLQGSLHPEEPHWYLPWIGVRPEAQGRGVGSALLAAASPAPMPRPARLSRGDEPPQRRPLCRHGFEVQAIVEAEDYPGDHPDVAPRIQLRAWARPLQSGKQ
jgi:GNAT superfamily N-acetyltransferase